MLPVVACAASERPSHLRRMFPAKLSKIAFQGTNGSAATWTRMEPSGVLLETAYTV